MTYRKKGVDDKVLENFQPSTIENIDSAFFEWISDSVNVYCSKLTGWSKVPIIWVAGERASQVKEDNSLRDASGALIFPLITIERTEISKNKDRKGKYWANMPPFDANDGSLAITRRIKQDKTAAFRAEQSLRRNGSVNFVSKKNLPKAILYETLYIPQPVYMKAVYSVGEKTQFQQQMNEILQAFAVKTGNVNYFAFGKQGHFYEGFMPTEYKLENSVGKMDTEERFFKTVLDIEVLGYINSSGKNHQTPKVVVRENIVEVKIGGEYVMLGEDALKQ